MKKRLLSLVLAVVLIVSILPFTAFATDGTWAGTGTAADPYQIADAADLAKLATDVNGGTNYKDSHFVMTNNIDMSGESWTAIGNSSSKKFAGTFDGKNFKIQNLAISNKKGFFGYTASSAVIKNIVFEDCSLSASSSAGLCVGENAASIINVHSVYSTSAKSIVCTGWGGGVTGVGGLVGLNQGLVDGCSNANTVSYSSNMNIRIGGIVGFNAGTIRNCFNTGTISSGGSETGGIAGANNSYNIGPVSGLKTVIENCYNWGAVGNRDSVGGIIGQNSSSSKNCYTAGSISGKSNVGAFHGNGINSSISNAFAIRGSCSNKGGATWVENNNANKAALRDTLNAWIANQSNPGLYKTWIFNEGDPGPSFDPNTYYTLTYVTDGGTIADDAVYTKAGKVASGAAIDTPTEEEITKADSMFLGWFSDSACTTAAPAAMPEADLTLYAKWARKMDYTVEYYFENAAGEFVKDNDKTETPFGYEGDTVTATPKAFDGYGFDSENKNNVLSDTLAATHETVLKLYYKLNRYTVTYKAAANTSLTADAVTSGLLTGADIPDAPAVTANDGYAIGDWTLVSGTEGADGKVGTTDLVYELTVSKTYTVTYKAAANTSLTADAVTSGLLTGADIPDAPAVTANDGYRLGNWTLVSGTEGADGKVGTTDLVYEITAIKQYTVTYTDGVNKVEIFADQSTTVDSGAATPAFVGTPSRYGFTFTGWSPAVAETVTADVTYTAQWQRIVFNSPAPSVVVTGLNTTDHVAYVIGRGDDMFVPGANVTRAEAATMFFRLMTDSYRNLYWDDECSYSDVKADAWYNVAIATLENMGAIDDTAFGGKFRPNDPITRAELAVMASQFCTVTGSVPGASFYDVPVTHWAYREIGIVQFANWIEGYNGYYRPEDNLTRAECVSIINRMLQRGAEADDMHKDMVTFKDNMNKDMWYYEAIQEAANSHDYTRTGLILTDEHFIAEKWTVLKDAPDWEALEKAWAAAAKNK